MATSSQYPAVGKYTAVARRKRLPILQYKTVDPWLKTMQDSAYFYYLIVGWLSYSTLEQEQILALLLPKRRVPSVSVYWYFTGVRSN